MTCNVTNAERVIALFDAKLPDDAHRAALISLMDDMYQPAPINEWEGVNKPYFISLIQKDRRIDAIKELRAIMQNREGAGLFGLKDAKDIIELFTK